MKNLTLLALLLTCYFNAFTQISLPRLSPLQKIEQRVGLTDVTVVYSRPSMKGRTIFGELEPFGELWRTGANRNTKITFSESVSIDNQIVKAGTYALMTRPNTDNWTVYLYTDTDNWDTPDTLETEKIATQINVPAQKLNRTIESLTINFGDLTATTASLGISWENTYVAVPIHFLTHQVMDVLIDKTLKRSATEYHLAAYYYLDNELDLETAKEWMTTAISIRVTPDYRDHLHLSTILDKLGDRKGAIQSAQRCLEIAKASETKYGVEDSMKILKAWGVEE